MNLERSPLINYEWKSIVQNNCIGKKNQHTTQFNNYIGVGQQLWTQNEQTYNHIVSSMGYSTIIVLKCLEINKMYFLNFFSLFFISRGTLADKNVTHKNVKIDLNGESTLLHL